MATLTRGYTFGATETVTNTKLHSLVDSGSISGIVDADIHASAAIANSKLAQITAASKVSGAALVSLPSVPSGAGALPLVNHAASPAANRVFLTTDGSTGSWGQVALASQISGALPIANGGTANTTANAALNALLPAQAGKTGYQLRSNGTNSGWSAGFQLFTANGLFYIPAGVTTVQVSLVGGGGGGGGGGDNGGGGGGGSGAHAIKVRIPVTPAGINTVVVGAAGSAGGVNANGGDGGLSSYGGDSGMKIKAHGGSGGKSYANGGAGGLAGTATSPNEIQSFAGMAGNSRSVRPYGDGAGSIWGLGGVGGTAGDDNATAGTGYGSGGGGAYSGFSGKAGAAGLVLVEW